MQEIEKTKYRAKLHRRLYSLFRVTTAVVQSFNMIVVIVVIVVVSGRPKREVELVKGVTQKIADFFELSPDPSKKSSAVSVIQDLNLVSDVAIVASVLYSLLIILSALVRYIYQCKDQNLLFMGKVSSSSNVI